MTDYALIIPVYNRPAELEELLHSIQAQSGSFEVIVVDDGSHESSADIAGKFEAHFPVRYFYKENSGPGPSRNYGAKQTGANTLIFLDSDCVLPTHFLEAVHDYRQNHPVELFGGPDRADHNFNLMQKAVNYAMTSYLTTGGIRGQQKQLEKYKPRSFNMGISHQAFDQVGGFDDMRYGEDIDLSIRMEKAGFRSALIPDAYVYHKRRTNLSSFFKQVFHSGKARIALTTKHPGSMKLVHVLPLLFTLGTLLLVLTSPIFGIITLAPLLLFSLLVVIHSSWLNRNPLVGLASVITSFTQLLGYGTGFAAGLLGGRSVSGNNSN